MSTSYFQDRLAHLGNRKEQIDSKTVSYVPVDGAAFDWQASVGTLRVTETTTEGLVKEYQVRDYIGPFATLGKTPDVGDKIVDGDLVCEVMAIAEATYLFTTERRDRIRVHTKVVAA